MKNLILTGVVLLTTIASMSGQGFTPPSDSNAVVYFVRVSNFGGAVFYLV